jgi:hypothetical protein
MHHRARVARGSIRALAPACRGLVALPGGVQALSARSLSRPLPGAVGRGREQLVMHRDSGELALAEDRC